MEHPQPYTIQFNYEIVEDAIRVQLQANVTVMPDNTYSINNIQHTGKACGSLIPPVILKKYKGTWIYADSKKETALSLAIGKAIDAHEQVGP